MNFVPALLCVRESATAKKNYAAIGLVAHSGKLFSFGILVPLWN